MSKHGEYRANAETALQMAARSDDDEFKAIMLKVAQGWLELAERAEKGKERLPPDDQRPNRQTH